MKRSYFTILSVVLALFLLSACCELPKKTLKTVSNAGFVKITADPEDADVIIDGTNVGKARDYNGKKQILQLEAGRHTIEISKEGYNSYKREMMVGAGATEDLNAALTKK